MLTIWKIISYNIKEHRVCPMLSLTVFKIFRPNHARAHTHTHTHTQTHRQYDFIFCPTQCIALDRQKRAETASA